MNEIFLSYSSKDRPAAARVQNVLSAAGYDVFWDQEVPAGQDWDAWIRARLSAAKMVVVLWSRESIASPNVRHEAMIARDAGKLVPAMIAPLKPDDFPMGLYLVQSIDLQDWREGASAGLLRLVGEARTRLGARGGPAAARGGFAGDPLARAEAKAAIAMASGQGWRKGLIGFAVAAAVLIGGTAVVLNLPRTPIPAPAPAPVANTAPNLRADNPEFADLLSRVLGHWTWAGQACAAGPHVTVEGDRLVFATPDTRFEHLIETVGSDGLSLTTRVVAPADAAGARYALAPLFFATNAKRANQLEVRLIGKDGPADIWDPCDVK
ncbi:MAG: toll/interleukin-1 receptor domain-containing protein [Caulobacterales bacterium]|jgi:hypothetical protein